MAQFKNFIPQMATVYREGVKKEIPAWKLVVGDIIEVGFGNNIPADIVLVQCTEMKVNNSSLTGESEEM